MYEINWGISNAANNRHPFAKVAANPTEDILGGSRFERSLSKYIESDVMAQTGISFDKALEMPSYQFKMLCEISRKTAEARSKHAANVVNNHAKGSGLPEIK